MVLFKGRCKYKVDVDKDAWLLAGEGAWREPHVHVTDLGDGTR